MNSAAGSGLKPDGGGAIPGTAEAVTFHAVGRTEICCFKEPSRRLGASASIAVKGYVASVRNSVVSPGGDRSATHGNLESGAAPVAACCAAESELQN